MLRFTDVKVSSKLSLLLGFVLLSLVSLVAVSIFVIRVFSPDGMHFQHIEASREIVENIEKLEINLKNNRVSLFTLLVESDDNQKAKLASSIDAANAYIERTFDQIINQDTEIPTRLSMLSALKKYREYQTTRDQIVIPHILQNDRSSIENLMSGIQKFRFDSYTAEIEKAKKIEESKLDGLVKKVELIEKIYIKFILAVVLGIVVLILCTALLISRHITKPVNELTNRVRQIINTDSGNRLPVNSNDEFGELARAFNHTLDEIKVMTAKFEMVLDAVPNAILMVDETGKILFLNKQVEALFGYSETELVGNNIEILLPVELKELNNSHPNNFFNTVSRQLVVSSEQIITRKDGSKFYAEIVTSLHKETHKKFIVASVTDISGRKKNEQEIQKITHAIEQSASIVMITDIKGDIEYVNPQFSVVTGYDRDEILGKNPRILKSGSLPSEQYSELWKTISHGKIWRGELLNRKKNNEFYWATATISPVRNNLGKITHYVGVQEDVTDRKILEDRLKQSYDDLEQFAYIASHDLQEPLRKIQGFGDILKEDYASKIDDDGQSYINKMQGASSRMSELISALLQYSRIVRAEELYAHINLNEIIRDVLSDLELAIKESGARITFSDLPSIDANEVHMRQLFQNFIGNAIKYVKHDVQPIIDISVKEVGNGNLQIIFTDNGIGISKEHLEIIFEPFKRLHTRAQYKGSGIGLSICKRIIEKHHGKIIVESDLGCGSRFIVQIPIKQKVRRKRV